MPEIFIKEFETMLSRKRKISLQVVSVILVAVMLMCQAMHLPHKAYAAVTDLYVGYSGKSNNREFKVYC